MKTLNYGGRDYQVDDNHVFIMELGRYTNSYNHYATFNTLDEAHKTYDQFNVSNGYKKRLKVSMPDSDIVLAKQTTRRND